MSAKSATCGGRFWKKTERCSPSRSIRAQELEKARENQWLLLSDVLRNVTEGKLRLCRALDELPPQQPNCGDSRRFRAGAESAACARKRKMPPPSAASIRRAARI